jgi:arylsulfatase A-like enzyme
LIRSRKQKLNDVFILADDQRFDELGCTGHPLIKTPNIDRLAREDALFENSFMLSRFSRIGPNSPRPHTHPGF